MTSIELGTKKIELKDNSPIQKAAEELGIPFSCKEGVCGSCLIKVKSGEDNLSDLNGAEKAYGLSGKKERLACQAKIKKGDVKITPGY